jgi:hypothetical protein
MSILPPATHHYITWQAKVAYQIPLLQETQVHIHLGKGWLYDF